MNRLLTRIALCTIPMLLIAAAPHHGVEIIESYNAAIGELPEGVAVAPNGDLYVTLAGTGELRRIDAHTGVGESFAQLDVGGGFMLGMAFRGDDLYVALASFVPETSGIWRIYEDGSAARVVDIQGFPNDLTFDKAGNMYVTESISGSIYKVAHNSTTPQLWLQDSRFLGDINVSPVPFPIGINGITYDDNTNSVIIANSQVPAIIEIKDHCGQPGSVSIIAAGEHLRGADGVALDREGDIYVGSNFNSTLLEVDRRHGTTRLVADASDGLVFPSTVAFGRHGNDKKSVYVANFGFGAGDDAPVGVLRIYVGEKGEKFSAGK
jgi:sugar lactone lactonase YvrE